MNDDDLIMGLLSGKPTLDSANMNKMDDDAMDEAALREVKLKAMSAFETWEETEEEDLSGGEGYADRLQALLLGIWSPDKDDDVDDDEQYMVDVACDFVEGWMEDRGVSEEDAKAILDDWDNEAAERVIDYLQAKDKGTFDDIYGGAYSSMPTLDATYKKKVVFKNGQKVIKRKRVSGHFKMTPAQKMAIKKAQRKSHNATANRKRMKSKTARKRAGK